MRAVLVVLMAVAIGYPTGAVAQKLPGNRVGAKEAKVYRDNPDGSTGSWKTMRVEVVSDGLVVGDQRLAYATIDEATYDRRKGGFRGMLRKPEVRHVLTVRYRDTEGTRQFIVIELGKDVAELTANRLESIGGVDVTWTDS